MAEHSAAFKLWEKISVLLKFSFPSFVCHSDMMIQRYGNALTEECYLTCLGFAMAMYGALFSFTLICTNCVLTSLYFVIFWI